MDRRRMLGMVGAFALATVMGGAAAVKTKAAKMAACCCCDACSSGAACCDACCNSACCGDTCCESSTSKTAAVQAVEDNSCCENDAQSAMASMASCRP
jgi:hypothetical protein